MESLAIEQDPVGLLIADDDSALRSLLAVQAHDALENVAVYEAADGAEAIQVALQRRPDIAVLDVNMPRLGGIEVALVLRELLPGLRLALHTSDPAIACDRARELCLPLFDKLESARMLRWAGNQLRAAAPSSGRGWDRTSDPSRVKRVLSR